MILRDLRRCSRWLSVKVYMMTRWRSLRLCREKDSAPYHNATSSKHETDQGNVREDEMACSGGYQRQYVSIAEVEQS